MKHLNDYSVIVFLSAGEAEKWEYVHLLKGFPTFLDQKHYNRMPNVTFPIQYVNNLITLLTS